MSREQLEALRAAILRAAAMVTDDISRSREGFDAAAAAMPAADDVELASARFGTLDGLWIRTPGADQRRCMLYFHGGAYVLGNAHGYRALVGELSRFARATALSVDYRLAPENPFPAAVEDGVASYRHLLDAGYLPGQIAIAGDSAGGGLAMATLVAAREAGLPMPSSACLLSPWLDLTCSSPSMETRAQADIVLTAERLRARARAYLGSSQPNHPHASPVFADLAGLPPLLIQVGDGEILLDEAIAAAGKAAQAGVRVTLDVWPQMLHVWHRFLANLDEARDAVAAAGAFMDGNFARAAADTGRAAA